MVFSHVKIKPTFRIATSLLTFEDTPNLLERPRLSVYSMHFASRGHTAGI